MIERVNKFHHRQLKWNYFEKQKIFPRHTTMTHRTTNKIANANIIKNCPHGQWSPKDLIIWYSLRSILYTHGNYSLLKGKLVKKLKT